MIDWSKVKTADDKAAEAHEAAMEACIANRKRAYREEADPIFFDYQRGEATEKQWKAKVAEIKKRFPKP